MSHDGSAGIKLRGGLLAITSFAIALGTFMQVLDSSVANVALPTIAGNLGVSTDQGTWIITSFAVANGVAVPLTGWLMGRYGVIRVFVLSVLAFTAASFLCAIAWSLSGLVLFRVLQGAVSGPMIPGSQALLIMIFPDNKRTTALGIWSITTLVAPICGPILGGYICDNYHWSWIFYINVPVGLFCGLLCWRNLAAHETPTRKLPIDTVGLGLLVIWVGMLQVMLDTGKDADWFSSSAITAEAIIAGVGFVVWLIWELTEAHPVVKLSLLRDRNFALGTTAFCLGYAVFFANVLLFPLWLQTQLGYTATWAGLVAAPSGVVAVILTPFVARFMEHNDARWVGTLSFVAFAISYFMRAALPPDATFWDFVWPFLVQGISMSTFFVAMMTISLHRIGAADMPSATGIANFSRIVAGSFATSIVIAMFDRREALHQSHLVDTPTLFNPLLRTVVEKLHDLGLSATQSYALLANQITGQAYLLSAEDLFWLSGWLSIAMIALVWLARRSVSAGKVHAGGE
jgi:DHA2 family multidrug resistance protein